MDAPPNLVESAQRLKKIFLANLAKRAQAGERLSDSEWQRLEESSAPPAPPAPAHPYAELAAAIAAARAEGREIPRHLAQAAREAYLHERAGDLWPNAGAAAQEIGCSVQSIRNWQQEGCPIPARAAIPKAPVYRWLWQRADARASTQAQRPEANPLDQAIKQARLDEKTGRLIAAADDHARQAVIRLANELRHRLVATLPGTIAEQIAKLDRSAAELRTRELILAALTAHRQDVQEPIPATPPTKESP